MLDGDIDYYSLWTDLSSELHARPFSPVDSPKIIIRCCFLETGQNTSEQDIIALLQWCRAKSIPLPNNDVRHFRANLPSYSLTWEKHSEFISLTWQFPSYQSAPEISQDIRALISPPFNVVVKTKITLDKSKASKLSKTSTVTHCLSQIAGTDTQIVTNFKADSEGFTNFDIKLHGLDPVQTGMLVRRVLELDTYRNLALLGFLTSKEITPNIAGIEKQTVKLTGKLNQNINLVETRKTLEEITTLAGSLANISANSQYRLSASRAYFKLVLGRLKRMQETPVDGHRTMEEFLILRLAPAMRTCESVENRIAKARSKLSDATRLLRTKIDIEMQAQNKALLESMNKRAIMQYRLQTTVESLSIAAVSYYVVGLLSYLLKGFDLHGSIKFERLVAICVPLTLITVWFLLNRIKKAHK